MIIGISGLINSGKDTCFQYIKQLMPEMKFQKLSFAEKVKDVCSVLFDWDRNMLEGTTPEYRLQRNNPDAFWSAKMQKPFTPRLALQMIGNEFKQLFCEDLWATIIEQQILKDLKKNYVITDLRYPDEIEMIERYGGYMFEIRRGELPDWYETARRYNQHEIEVFPDCLRNVHPSEWKWIGQTHYTIIQNDGSLEDFKQNVQQALLEQGMV